VEPRFTNAPVHEQIFRAKNISDNERCLGLRTRKMATAVRWEYRRGSHLLVNFGSVYIPALFRFTNYSVHEQIFRAKNITDDERCLGLRTRKLATAAIWEYQRGSVSCWLTLAQYTSLLDFGLRTFRFTNGLQERIKFVNRGSTVVCAIYYRRLFISPSGISELDCATTKTDRHGRTEHINRQRISPSFFFVLGAVAYLQDSPLGGQSWRNMAWTGNK
jgi:hypothetical protein